MSNEELIENLKIIKEKAKTIYDFEGSDYSSTVIDEIESSNLALILDEAIDRIKDFNVSDDYMYEELKKLRHQERLLLKYCEQVNEDMGWSHIHINDVRRFIGDEKEATDGKDSEV